MNCIVCFYGRKTYFYSFIFCSLRCSNYCHGPMHKEFVWLRIRILRARLTANENKIEKIVHRDNVVIAEHCPLGVFSDNSRNVVNPLDHMNFAIPPSRSLLPHTHPPTYEYSLFDATSINELKHAFANIPNAKILDTHTHEQKNLENKNYGKAEKIE